MLPLPSSILHDSQRCGVGYLPMAKATSDTSAPVACNIGAKERRSEMALDTDGAYSVAMATREQGEYEDARL